MNWKCWLLGHTKRHFYISGIDDSGLISFGTDQYFKVRICDRCSLLYMEAK